MAGRATIFIRSFGCDSLCNQCDTLYAVDPNRADSKYEMMSAQQIASRVYELDDTFLPITFSGGNPAIWDMEPVIDALDIRHSIWVETQGTFWRDWIRRCHVVVVSPKGPFMDDRKQGLTTIKQLKEFVDNVSHKLYFKVVVGGPEDFAYAEEITRHFPSVPMYLSLGCPQTDPPALAVELLDAYRTLSAMLLEHKDIWPKLVEHAQFIPQLHVLTHGTTARKV